MDKANGGLNEQADVSARIRQIVGPFARAVLTKSAQGYLAVPVEDVNVGQSLRFSGAYGQDELNRLLSLCTNPRSALVVGAHIGALAVARDRQQTAYRLWRNLAVAMQVGLNV